MSFARDQWNHAVNADGSHNVTQEWFHPSHSEHPTHSLFVGHTPHARGQEAAMVALSRKLPSGLYDYVKLVRPATGGWYVSKPGAPHTPVAAPSETLQALLRGYHEAPDNAAWMPLLDELETQYPEHFTEAVAHHTHARMQ